MIHWQRKGKNTPERCVFHNRLELCGSIAQICALLCFFFELLILGEDKQVYGPYEILYAIIGCLTAFFATLWPFVVNFCDHLSSAPAKEFEKMDKDWWC